MPERRVANQESAAAAVDALRPSLATLVEQIDSLSQDVAHNEDRMHRRNLILMAIAGLAAAFTFLILLVVIQTNHVAGSARKTAERMADCTTAGGKCYEEGSKRTGAAIADLIKADTYVAECARMHPGEYGPKFDATLEQCVSAKLKASHK